MSGTKVVQNLAATFNNTDVAQSGGFGVQSRQRGIAALQSADMSAHSKNATKHYDSLPVGKLSPLQENETCYYATTVLAKTNDRFEARTVAWPKEPLASWLARAENQPALRYRRRPWAIHSLSSAGCTDDTWTATSGPPDARGGHTAVWTGSEMIVWGGIRGFTALSIPAADIIPVRTTGRRPVPPTRPQRETVTQPCGLATK